MEKRHHKKESSDTLESVRGNEDSCFEDDVQYKGNRNACNKSKLYQVTVPRTAAAKIVHGWPIHYALKGVRTFGNSLHQSLWACV